VSDNPLPLIITKHKRIVDILAASEYDERMVKKQATKTSLKKVSPATSRAKSVKKASTTVRKKPARTQKRSVSDKVDYYPNRMTVAVSALAGTLLVLFALIAVLGTQ
jgi:hypothetical protein